MTVQFRVKNNTKTHPGHFSDRDFFTTPVVARFFSLLAVINIDRLFVCLDIAFLSYIHIALFVQAAIAPAPPFQAFVVLLFLFPSEPDGPKLAGCLAVSAGNALAVSHFSDVHFTGSQAGVAVHTLSFVQLDGKQRDPVKQTVECP